MSLLQKMEKRKNGDYKQSIYSTVKERNNRNDLIFCERKRRFSGVFFF